MTRAVLSLALLLATGLSAVGCTSARAQFPEQQPTLVVPPVPPRAIEPVPVVAPPAEPPPVEPPPPPPPTNKPSRPRPQAEAKPDSKETLPEVVTTTPTPPPVAPLRSATAPTGPEATRQIREIIDTTQKMLDKVDYPNQSDDRKANYTTAKAYIQQAEEAMKKEELTQARSFAERAQNIAKVLLSGR